MVLLVAYAIMVVYKNQPGVTPHGLFYGAPVWYQVFKSLDRVFISFSLIAAVLCSHKIADLVSKLCESTPMQDSPEIAAFTFRLALLNCWPSLIPIVLHWIIFEFQLFSRYPSVLKLTWLGFTSGLDQVATYSILLLFIVALAVLPAAPKWVSWLFFFCTIAFSGIFYMVYFGIPDSLAMRLYDNRVYAPEALHPLYSVLLTLLAVGVLYGIVYLYCREKTKAATLLTILVGVHIVLEKGSIGIGIFPIDLFISCGWYYWHSLQPISSDSFGISMLSIDWVVQKSEFHIPLVLAALPPIMSVFWLAVHFHLLSWMIRKVKPRTPV